MKEILSVYAAYSINDDVRLQSSSGAIFSSVSDFILSVSGVIYGVAMTNDCYSAEFIRASDEDGLSRIRGSKYFQAKIGNTFKDVKKDLDSGRQVLFSGTGCQVNGLKCFLGKEYNNLICVDIVCHGTPSPKLWKEYVEYQESKFNAKMKSVSFRCKDRNNWDGFEMKEIDENNKEVYVSRHIDLYFQMFVKNICLRPSCHECMAKKVKMSDMSIADFWGIENVAPEMNDNKGISLVIVRSNKGIRLFDLIKDKLKYKEVSYEDGVRDNTAEYKPYEKPKVRDIFFKDMNELTFEELSKKYLKVSFKRKVKLLLLKTPIRKFFF